MNDDPSPTSQNDDPPADEESELPTEPDPGLTQYDERGNPDTDSPTAERRSQP